MSIPDQLLTRLRQRYSEPHRKYHTWTHIEALLAHYAVLERHFFRKTPVLWAIYWHDAVYDPQAKDNEIQSAELLKTEAVDFLDELDLASAILLIEATERHEVMTGLSLEDRADMELFLDIDLSILGAREVVFDNYERNIRQEYSFVSDDAFRSGRSKVLRSFLERDHIFYSEVCRQKWETQARKNLLRALDKLEG